MMKWSELSTEERDRLMHTKVMGNPEFCIGKLIIDKVDSPSRAGGIAFSYWRAVCTNCVFVWSNGDKNKFPKRHAPVYEDSPSYSTDMNAAWHIVEHIAVDESDHSRASRFMLWWENNSLWAHSAQQAIDAICLWALEDYGVEIEP
jgi:hypothetical protein